MDIGPLDNVFVLGMTDANGDDNVIAGDTAEIAAKGRDPIVTATLAVFTAVSVEFVVDDKDDDDDNDGECVVAPDFVAL